ncbi:putative bifunctional diguanylate cyclase/phosphodiesterase [Acidicapsa ligni]|uniref:putative bifunctional diguanylate cyclase/phosphodiesterase n=1 Tax=Acidicapsa ligni TaxID=542300 RepID=UPI0021E03B5F|nr:bifunctional diguanylate cyclase/phosphodiesterase [Acidicapsa ligni]
MRRMMSRCVLEGIPRKVSAMATGRVFACGIFPILPGVAQPHLVPQLHFSAFSVWWLMFTVAFAALSVAMAILLQRRITLYRLQSRLDEDRDRLTSVLNERHVTRLQNETLREEIQERKRMEAQVRHLAFHDNLTGLGNRTYLLESIEKALKSPQGRFKVETFLIYLDLDQFKAVNEMLGHRDGDLLLQEIARRLQKFTRAEDIVARIGGDEFCILFERLHGIDQAKHIAERILGSIEEPLPLDFTYLPLTASIGICKIEARYAEGEDVLRDADTAMHRAKRSGGNRYVVYDSAMHDEALSVIQTTLQLRSAIDNNEFVLYHQPLIDMRDMSINGVESLIRWNHPKRGLLFPGSFIQLAEETGYIVPMGAWTLRQACQDIRVMRQAFKKDLLLSLNVSSRQLDDPAFISKLMAHIQSSDANPGLLQLEITESVFLKDPEKAGALFREVRAMGVKVALDDFGTGYSSLSYLQRYPVDTLKIDQSFVRDMRKGSFNRSIVQLLIDLAHGAGMRVIAEGVEDIEHAESLMSLGCYFAQGYLFSRPIPMDALLDLMKWGIRLPQAEALRYTPANQG